MGTHRPTQHRQAEGAPAAPSGLAASPLSGSVVVLFWEDQSHNEAGFRVERRTMPREPEEQPGPWGEVGAGGGLPADTTEYHDTGLAPGRTYEYRLRARNAAGDSAYGTITSAYGTIGTIASAETESPTSPLVAGTGSAVEDRAYTLVLAGAGPAAVPFSGWSVDWGDGSAVQTLGGGPGLASHTYRDSATYTATATAHVQGGVSAAVAHTVAVAPAAPAAPSGLSVTPISNTQLRVSFTDNSDNETGFEIELTTSGEPADTLIMLGGGTHPVDPHAGQGTVPAVLTVACSYTSAPAPVVEYQARVRAVNAGSGATYAPAHSGYSNREGTRTLVSPSVAVPAAPWVRAESNGGERGVWVHFGHEDPPQTPVVGYEIERSVGGGTFDSSTIINSNTAAATTRPALPPAPGLAAAALSATSVGLAWAEVPGADGYRLERSADGGESFQPVAGAGHAGTVDGGLAAGVTYLYRLWSYNASGESTSPAEAWATTHLLPTVTVMAPDAWAGEAGPGGTKNLGRFVVRRDGGTGGALAVDLRTTPAGGDFTLNPSGTVSIGAGYSAAVVTLDPRLDDLYELTKTVEGWVAIEAGEGGYVQRVEIEQLVRDAAKHDLVLRLDCRPGQYVQADDCVIRAWPGERVDAGVRRAPRGAFTVHSQRSLTQDAEFAVDQLVEIAARAISPGINDPFTAVQCVDRLGEALPRLAGRPMPTPYRVDPAGRLRVVARPTRFCDFADAAFNQIRHDSGRVLAVMLRLLEAFGKIARHVCHGEDRACLAAHARAVYEQATAAATADMGRRAVEERYAAFTEALRRSEGPADQGAGSAASRV